MKILGIIPARAGSKSIKNKNIINLNGKPLIAHTIMAAKNSKLQNFIVSSDSKKILNIAKKFGAKNLFLRPKKFSLDSTRSVNLYKFLKKELEKFFEFDAIMVLQPTTPLRRSEDINKSIDFYSNILGMELHEFLSSTDNVKRKSLKFGKQKINLHEASKPFKPHANNPLPGTMDICFLSEINIDDWIKLFNKFNINIEDGPVQKTGANGPIRSIYVRDPDKNLIEISNQI